MALLSLFKKSSPVIDQKKSEIKQVDVVISSILSADVESAGDLILRGNLRIDGVHVGNIRKSDLTTQEITVHIGKTGKVEGIIEVDNIIVDGEVSGTMIARLNLYSSGTVSGEAIYGQEVDITGNFKALCTKSFKVEEKLINPAKEFQVNDNVHPLQMRSTT